MLEAVNSVLQTAPLARANNEQVSTTDSFAGNPDRVQRAPQAPQAPFVSPHIFLDVNFDKAIIQLRNGETGDVIDQFPSEAALKQQARRAAAQQAAREAEATQQTADTVETAAPQQQAQAANTAAVTQEQIAAFEAAAQSGNSNAGNVSLLA